MMTEETRSAGRGNSSQYQCVHHSIKYC